MKVRRRTANSTWRKRKCHNNEQPMKVRRRKANSTWWKRKCHNNEQPMKVRRRKVTQPGRRESVTITTNQ